MACHLPNGSARAKTQGMRKSGRGRDEFNAPPFADGARPGRQRAPCGATGAEPVESFLAALRSAKYYDEALDYLEQLDHSPHVSAELRERLEYEQAVTLLSSAAAQSDPQQRRATLRGPANYSNNSATTTRNIL